MRNRIWNTIWTSIVLVNEINIILSIDASMLAIRKSYLLLLFIKVPTSNSHGPEELGIFSALFVIISIVVYCWLLVRTSVTTTENVQKAHDIYIALILFLFFPICLSLFPFSLSQSLHLSHWQYNGNIIWVAPLRVEASQARRQYIHNG